jgi:hypothetical protein
MLRLPCGLFPSGFLIETLHALRLPLRAKCTVHPIFLDLTIVIIVGEDYKLRSNFFQPPIVIKITDYK